jgi:hypothetical protein
VRVKHGILSEVRHDTDAGDSADDEFGRRFLGR